MNSTADEYLRAIAILLIILILCVLILIGVGILQNEDQGNIGYSFLYIVFGILAVCVLGLLIFSFLLFLFNLWGERRSGESEYKPLASRWTSTNQQLTPSPQSNLENKNPKEPVTVSAIADNVLKGNTQPFQEEVKIRSQQPQEQMQQRPKPKYSTSAQFQLLQEMYNRATDDTSQRQAFRELYNPIRFGTSNAMQRREDFSIAANFQTANDGDYYAVRLENLDPARYAVVPRFDLTFQESSYGPGAMGEAFICQPQFDPQLRYRRVRVRQAAIFESDDKQNWTLVQPGELQLGQGE